MLLAFCNVLAFGSACISRTLRLVSFRRAKLERNEFLAVLALPRAFRTEGVTAVSQHRNLRLRHLKFLLRGHAGHGDCFGRGSGGLVRHGGHPILRISFENLDAVTNELRAAQRLRGALGRRRGLNRTISLLE